MQIRNSCRGMRARTQRRHADVAGDTLALTRCRRRRLVRERERHVLAVRQELERRHLRVPAVPRHAHQLQEEYAPAPITSSGSVLARLTRRILTKNRLGLAG